MNLVSLNLEMICITLDQKEFAIITILMAEKHMFKKRLLLPLLAQELKEYFSKDSQEFCKNVFNPEFAETCSNFKINKSSLEEYKEYLDMLDKIEEYSAKADYRNMLKKVEQWVTRSF